MEVAAVYLQPIEMEPEGMMRKASESDIHLEADIHALANNPNGFEEGAWVPYLAVKFEVSKIGSDYKVSAATPTATPVCVPGSSRSRSNTNSPT